MLKSLDALASYVSSAVSSHLLFPGHKAKPEGQKHPIIGLTSGQETVDPGYDDFIAENE
jgi:hypothetical protein